MSVNSGNEPRRNTARAFVVFLTFVALLVFAFFPVLTTPYGLWEDFPVHLAPAGEPGSQSGIHVGFLRLILASGRLVNVGLYYAVMKVAPFVTLKTLWVYRLLSIMGIAGIAVLVFKELRHAIGDQTIAWLLAATSVLGPAFQFHAAWAHVFFQPVAAIIAYLAYRASLASLHRLWPEDASAARRFWAATLYSLLAVLALFLALNIYQPAAMFFWVFSGLWLLRPAERPVRLWAQLGFNLSLFAIALSFAFVSLKLSELYLADHLDRANLVRNPWDKMAWFVREPLSIAFSPFQLQAMFPVAGILGLLVVGTLLWRLPGSFLQRLALLVGPFTILALCFLPNLLVAESNLTFRSMIALSCLATAYSGVALVFWLQRWFPSRQSLIVGLLGSSALAGVLFAQFNLAHEMAGPLAMEHALLREQLALIDYQQVRQVRIILPYPLPWITRAEFGQLNCSQGWAAVQGVRAMLKEVAPQLDVSKLAISCHVPAEPIAADATGATYVIDMRPIAWAVKLAR